MKHRLNRATATREDSSRGKRRLNIAAARNALRLIAKRISVSDPPWRLPATVAGFDLGYKHGIAVGAGVILRYKDLKMIEAHTVVDVTRFPYIPGLLSFREAPLVFKIYKTLKVKPDVLLINGHGLAHPLRCGLASYVGGILQRPTIGVAKGLLCGSIGEGKGTIKTIVHHGEVVGAVLRRPRKKAPLYVSVGNMMTLNHAVRITRHCWREGSLPEPLQMAHNLAHTTLQHTLTLNDPGMTAERA